MAAPTDNRNLADDERELQKRLFTDTLSFPLEYKQWLRNFIEQSDIRLPTSAINLPPLGGLDVPLEWEDVGGPASGGGIQFGIQNVGNYLDIATTDSDPGGDGVAFNLTGGGFHVTSEEKIYLNSEDNGIQLYAEGAGSDGTIDIESLNSDINITANNASRGVKLTGGSYVYATTGSSYTHLSDTEYDIQISASNPYGQPDKLRWDQGTGSFNGLYWNVDRWRLVMSSGEGFRIDQMTTDLKNVAINSFLTDTFGQTGVGGETVNIGGNSAISLTIGTYTGSDPFNRPWIDFATGGHFSGVPDTGWHYYMTYPSVFYLRDYQTRKPFLAVKLDDVGAVTYHIRTGGTWIADLPA